VGAAQNKSGGFGFSRTGFLPFKVTEKTNNKK
jgi:hypothetical protein